MERMQGNCCVTMYVYARFLKCDFAGQLGIILKECVRFRSYEKYNGLCWYVLNIVFIFLGWM